MKSKYLHCPLRHMINRKNILVSFHSIQCRKSPFVELFGALWEQHLAIVYERLLKEVSNNWQNFSIIYLHNQERFVWASSIEMTCLSQEGTLYDLCDANRLNPNNVKSNIFNFILYNLYKTIVCLRNPVYHLRFKKMLNLCKHSICVSSIKQSYCLCQYIRINVLYDNIHLKNELKALIELKQQQHHSFYLWLN